jgi:tetratricopeptide (TPR) repeat protein
MRTDAGALVLAVVLWGMPAHAQRPTQGDDESAALVEEGRAALKRHALGDAATALDQAIALNPRRVEAYVLRSAVYVARKQYKDGVQLMRRAQVLAPADKDVLAALGTHLMLSGDTGAGVPLLEQVVAASPQRYDAELLLGHHRYEIGDWPKAIAALEAYFQYRPGDLVGEDRQHRVELADAYLRDRQAQKALAAFHQAASEGKPDLRARLGIAWATAAISCRDAQAPLRELEPVADAYPEVWLVEGRCALALGDTAAALERGLRYSRSQPNKAAGHALVGEAYAASNNLTDAMRELETASALEPEQRRWTIRRATMLRRLDKAREALAVLDKLGPPASAADDPDWWIELGEGLLANSDPQAVIARLLPITSELSTSAPIRVVLGAAQLAAGQAELAVQTLTEAEAIASTPRSQQLLAHALARVAAVKLSAGDAGAAEPLLARADSLVKSALILRDLGIARLVLDRPGEALAALDRAIELEPSPITLMLDARAHALAGDLAGARRLYDRADRAIDPRHPDDGKIAVEIAIDRAATELAIGDPADAVTALEKTIERAKLGPLAERHRAALAKARHAAGVKALRAGNGARAVEYLDALVKELVQAPIDREPVSDARCDLALATVVSGDAASAQKALDAVGGQPCPFPPPADVHAVPILRALIEGLSPRQASPSLDRLAARASKVSGPAAALLQTATRAVALAAAEDAYRNGNLAQARRFLTTAKGTSAQTGSDEVAYDLALFDLVDGKVDAAITQLERLAPKVPDALVTLGVAYERKGDPQKALETWRRARKAGSRFAMLAEWIAAKERIYGEPP